MRTVVAKILNVVKTLKTVKTVMGSDAHPLKRILFLEDSFLVLLCNLLFLLFQPDHSPATTHEMSAVMTLSSGSIS